MLRTHKDLTEDDISKLNVPAGLDLSHAARRAFLKRMASCDVQAVPGAGKTTLLGCKLELLAENWRPEFGAVAVLSHTNVARREIEKQLHGRSSEMMLRYPHFVGTLTQFIHVFLAMPAAAGMGFKIASIDEDMFNLAMAAALRKAGAARTWLSNQAGREVAPTTPFIEKVRLGAAKIAPLMTVDKENPRQMTAHSGLVDRSTSTFRALNEVREAITERGIFSFEDMLAVALYALNNTKGFASTLSRRFPLIILDEAQDTEDEALQVLRKIEAEGTALQAIGDVNQAILSSGSRKGDGILVFPLSSWTNTAVWREISRERKSINSSARANYNLTGSL